MKNETYLLHPVHDWQRRYEALRASFVERWRIENGIAEAVKFLHLNSLSSPILIKVHFDVLMTMMADTSYCMLARKLRGFEECDAAKIYRHFVHGSGRISVEDGMVNVVYPRRAHNPILRSVNWDKLPCRLAGLRGAKLGLSFQ